MKNFVKNATVGKIAAMALVIPLLLFAYASGPDPRKTGAPGDATCNDAGCHNTFQLNSGTGSVRITFPSGMTYTPGGPRIQLAVQVSEGAARTYGFQATARLESNLTGGQAGSWDRVDTTTVVLCDDGSIRPTAGCRSNFSVQFIEHTLSRANGQWNVFWTPPATNVGNVRIYIAGNAANGDGTERNDRIYTASYTLTPSGAPPPPPPTISAGGVADAFNFAAGIAPSSWTVVVGTNFTTTEFKDWGAITGTTLPTSVDGVSVSIDGRPATVYYVTPTQLGILAPHDLTAGSRNVVVTNANGSSVPLAVQAAAVKPAWFTPQALGGKLYVVAVALDGTYVGRVGTDSRVRRGVRPGETFLLFGTGFGATNPVVPSTQVVSGAPAVTTPVRIRFGESVASFAGTGNLVFSGLYQFNVTVPAALAPGEYQLIAEQGGVTSSTNVYIVVER
ncbi:MAG: hypothetical protein HYZ37_10665 [Candidatus Solibacter usitatus]|nr:hypothetical protein [Candidatus Solibacter usitatus]